MRLCPRKSLDAIVVAALQASDPYAAVIRYLHTHPWAPELILGVGKAAEPMARAALEVTGAPATIVVRHGDRLEPLTAAWGLTVHTSSHPIPDEASVKAVSVLLQSHAVAPKRVLFLLSGGTSALMVEPAGPLSLDELRRTHRLLVESGASIDAINTVRKHISGIKGGQFARRLCAMWPGVEVLVLVLSDCVGDRLESIGSGPLAPDPTTFADALALLDDYGLRTRVPSGVLAYLKAGADGVYPETVKPLDAVFERVEHRIVVSRRDAARAALEAATESGWCARLCSTDVEGEARDVGRWLAKQGLDSSLGTCLIFAGETTVTLRGAGRGGRNQETVLAASLALEGKEGVTVASFATDGIDGPTDTAGAIADGQTVARARRLGLDARDFLERNDSFTFFDALGDRIVTGATRTNVNDVMVVWRT